MSSAKQLISVLTVEAVADAVGVDQRTVTNKASGKLPAYWWLAVSRLAEARGVDCPHDAFAFARANVAADRECCVTRSPTAGDAA